MTYPKVSIIMPALNSQKSIAYSLESIRKQDYPQEKIEILVIDGGSKDKTKQIARKYKAKIINNPLIQPEIAKSIGLQKAIGKFAMFLDSDEVLGNPESIKNKVIFLTLNPKCKNIVTTGLIKPVDYPFLCDYMNRYGEPFSFFIYRIDGGDYFNSLKNRYQIVKMNAGGEEVKFLSTEIPPIVDGGGHFFDLEYLKSIEDIRDPSLSAKVFPAMNSHTHRLGVLRDDYVIHYSTTDLSSFLRKIKWRIVSNLSTNNKASGYKNREKYLPSFIKLKKVLFFPYAFFLVLPLYDSIFLSIKHKNISYLAHFPFTLYTAVMISILLSQKFIFNRPLPLKEYK